MWSLLQGEGLGAILKQSVIVHESLVGLMVLWCTLCGNRKTIIIQSNVDMIRTLVFLFCFVLFFNGIWLYLDSIIC